MNEAQQTDLLDLELSHEPEDDVDKPVSNDGMDLDSKRTPDSGDDTTADQLSITKRISRCCKPCKPLLKPLQIVLKIKPQFFIK